MSIRRHFSAPLAIVGGFVLALSRRSRHSTLAPAMMKRGRPDLGSPSPGLAARQVSGSKRRPMAEAMPSASVVLVSPDNEVLQVRRVQSSRAFPSAHVFPGGNVSAFHDQPFPDRSDPTSWHGDGAAYRLAAIRETFEESNILLARDRTDRNRRLIHLPHEVSQRGRKAVHGNRIPFLEWLSSVNAEPDINGLIPFTRWVTPPHPPKRYTTQMYIYMLPLADDHVTTASKQSGGLFTAEDDRGVETTEAAFASPQSWLEQARRREIVLFPPQVYLLHLLSAFLVDSSKQIATAMLAQSSTAAYAAQRKRLLNFIEEIPDAHPIAPVAGAELISSGMPRTSWAEKIISPEFLSRKSADGRSVLRLDRPGPELKGSNRWGDSERVILVDFSDWNTPRDVEVVYYRDLRLEGSDASEPAEKPSKL